MYRITRQAWLRRVLAASLLAVTCLVLITTSAKAQVPLGYTLAFGDEFNGTSLDTAAWQYRTDAKALSQQLAANVSVSNGLLHVALKKQTVGSYNYTGGGIITINKYRYGYYEARVKSPPGAGWHTAFWSQAYNGSNTGTQVANQEIDFDEQNSHALSTYNTNYFKWNPTPSVFNIGTYNGSGISPNFNNFHVIGALFTPTRVIFYLDGVQYSQTADITAYPIQNDANIWLTSIAFTSPVDDTLLPAEYQVDWVHFYAAPAGSQPSVPTGLTATSEQNAQVPLSWSASSGATSYNVKRSLISGGPYTTVVSPTTTSYTDAGLINGTTYYYVVSAVNSAPLESNDATQVVATPGSAINTVIKDNADASGVVITGTWTTSTFNSGYYGTNYIHDGNTGNIGGKTVKFTPSIPTTGTYAVYLNWPAAANRATNTPVDVFNGTTTTSYTVNQQLNGSWALVGTFQLNAGTTAYVKVRNDGANGYVIADAVKFILQ
jgi:hypothetical protein